jgi:hypothetical protein
MRTSLLYLILLLLPSLVREVWALSPMKAGIAVVETTLRLALCSAASRNAGALKEFTIPCLQESLF